MSDLFGTQIFLTHRISYDYFQAYRHKIDSLEQSELEREALQDENFRLREEMQSRYIGGKSFKNSFFFFFANQIMLSS